MIDYVLIGMVLNEPLTGYDIKKYIEVSIGNFFKVSYGNLYPALKKLADKGFLTTEEEMQGNRIKKYYQATELGKAEFLEWLSAPADFSAKLQAFMVKIFFFGELPENIRKQRFYECELYIQQGLQKLNKMKEQYEHFSSESDRAYFEVATLHYAIQNGLHSLRWIRYIKEKGPLSEFLQGGNYETEI